MQELYEAIGGLRKSEKLKSNPNPVLHKFITNRGDKVVYPSKKLPKKSDAEMIQEFFAKGNTVTVLPDEKGEYHEKCLSLRNFDGILS